MKKVININFKGRVIPIEETAFEQLQRYIESLRRYFANEEGRDEIINDIEDRIAELFEEDLKKGSACITDETVNNVLNSMGRVEDFAEMDNEPSMAGASGGSSSFTSTPDEPRGSMSRNANDKVLGGVCSGIAHYLKIDPTVVRVLFALVTLGGFGTGILIYIVLWIVLPIRNLQTNIKKRLFRDPDEKVVGGVASGIAKYFNIPVWVPRIVFILPFILGILSSIFRNAFFDFDFNPGPIFFTGGFGGTLFLTYIVLWIILPKASSATDKLQMRGEKLDVGSISKAVKEDLKKMGEDVKSGAHRISEEMKEGSSRISEEVKERAQSFASEAKPVAQSAGSGIGNAIGILFKVFFLIIAACIAIPLLIALFGISVAGIVAWPLKDYFFEGASQNFAVWGTLVFFLFVPVIAFFIWVVRKIFNIRSKRSYLGYVFGGLWIIGWVCVVMLLSGISKNIRQRDKVETPVEIIQPLKNKMIVTVSEPKVQYNGYYWWIDSDSDGWDIDADTLKLSTVRVRVEQSTDSAYGVSVIRSSYGHSRQNAKERAGKIEYHVSYKDSVLDLGSYMAIAKQDKFRGQNTEVVVKVPVGGKIRFEKSVERKLNPVNYRFTHKNRWNRMDEDWDVDVYTDLEYTSDVDYIMTKDGLHRADGKETEKYEYNKDTDSKEELKEIERKKEELRQKEEELKKQTDTTRYRYQKQIAEYRNNEAPFFHPITVSAL
jgi:phage shock protein PspC (stress-responsive transcriptional regulator)